MERCGRRMSGLDLSIQILAGGPHNHLPTRVSELLTLGFRRLVFLVAQTRPADQWPVLESGAALLRDFS
jgi:hypothetical protein